MKTKYENNIRKILFIEVLLLFLIYIFQLIDAVILPNCVILLLLAVLMIMIPTLLLKIIPLKWKISALTISFIVASANWIFVSYNSFYDGVAFNLYNEANVLYTSTSMILKSTIPDNEKKNLLKAMYEKSFAEITVEKNDKPFVFAESKRSKDEYQLEPIIDTRYIFTDNGKYNFKYSYANQPFLNVGLTRAISFSVFPDIITNEKFNNFYYIKNKLYNRSITLWSAFIILYFLFLSIAYYKTKIDRSNENIAEIYKYMHLQMVKDINNITTSKAKNVLQDLLTNWNMKQISSSEYETTYEAASEAARSTKHDLGHKWTDKNEFYLNNKEDIKPYITEILNDLNDIPKVISIRAQKYSIGDILEKLNEIDFINGSQRKERGLNFVYTPVSLDLVKENEYCEVNLERIKSIVNNLIGNSVEATNVLKRKFRTKHKSYERNIHLKTDIKLIDGKKYFIISIKDNGGGFPEPDKIYKEIVVSSRKNADGSVRVGEGTSYINFFVHLYNGHIEAENYLAEEDLSGASTKIYFPIIF
ncbi:MAG: hypothetical protein DBY32_09600 [Phascolarctobacterium sp.]|nr:MAG: hypothetical protein DBY32_09600 [Phascolarctobacterium sp.]